MNSLKFKKDLLLDFLLFKQTILNSNMRRRSQRRRKGNYQTRRNTGRKKRKQRWGFLNRYDFAYDDRDTVNQFAKVTPGVFKSATKDIDEIAKNTINQIVSIGGAEIERVLPKILLGEDVYQTPFK